MYEKLRATQFKYNSHASACNKLNNSLSIGCYKLAYKKGSTFYELLAIALNFFIRNDLRRRSYSFHSLITEQRRMKLKRYQDKYLCFRIIFNHAKFLKDLTCWFLTTSFSTISLFNVLAHRYQKHRKNDLIEANRLRT